MNQKQSVSVQTGIYGPAYIETFYSDETDHAALTIGRPLESITIMLGTSTTSQRDQAIENLDHLAEAIGRLRAHLLTNPLEKLYHSSTARDIEGD